MSYFAFKVEQAQSEILNLIRSWDGYETDLAAILHALDGVAEELLREKAERTETACEWWLAQAGSAEKI